MAGITSRSAAALFRHEGRIITRTARRIVRTPGDLATVALALPLLILLAIGWISGLPDEIVRLQAAGLGFIIPFLTVRFAIDRCEYHRTDGALAAHAQLRGERTGFALPVILAAIAASGMLATAIGLEPPLWWLAGTLAGLLAGAAWASVEQRLAEGRARYAGRRAIVGFLDRCSLRTLAISGAILGIPLAFVPMPIAVRLAMVLAFCAMTIFLFARIDAAAVRFRTTIGHHWWWIVQAQLARPVAALAPFAIALAAGPHHAAAAIAGLSLVFAALLVALRALAFQSFGRRAADWIVTIGASGCAMIGMAFPPLALAAFAALFAWLVRRARREAWMIV